MKHDDDLAHELALAFLTPSEQPQGLAAAGKTDETAQPDEPAEKKRKVHFSVFDFAVTKEQQAQIRKCIGNWFVEASDAMAPHAIEHPRAKEKRANTAVKSYACTSLVYASNEQRQDKLILLPV